MIPIRARRRLRRLATRARYAASLAIAPVDLAAIGLRRALDTLSTTTWRIR